MYKVCKFGGSSVADAAQINKVLKIVLDDPQRRIVVVSAPGKRDKNDVKVTDLLISIAEKALAGEDTGTAIDAVAARYGDIAAGLGIGDDVAAAVAPLCTIEAAEALQESDVIVGYTVYRNGFEVADVSDCGYVDRELETGVEYSYRVEGYLDNGESAKKDQYEEACRYASERELVAADAERTSTKYKLVEFMMDKIGEEYDGHVSGVTEWGMYVEIEPTKIEGMVSVRDIKSDFYEFDEPRYRLVGKRRHHQFCLGDPVRIRVKSANLEQRLLDYELVEEEATDASSSSEGRPAPVQRKRSRRKPE